MTDKEIDLGVFGTMSEEEVKYWRERERRYRESGYHDPLITDMHGFKCPRTELPPRPWLVRGLLMAGYVTMIIGAPDQGKSLLAIMWAVCVASGRGWGDFRPEGSGKVMLCLAEEDWLEQDRRFYAACDATGAPETAVTDNVVRFAIRRNQPLFTLDPDTREVVPTQAWEKVVELVETERPTLLVFDPMAEFHACEENQNAQMKAVVAHLRDIARANKLAAVLIHHTKKGEHEPGDLEASRGASAIGAAARFAVEVTTMTTAEAKRFGLPEERRRFFFRVDNARAAYAPPAEHAEWFEKSGFEIGPAKDSTPALVPWTAPKAVPPSDAVLDRLVDGIATGYIDPDTNELMPWSPQLGGPSARSVHVLLTREGLDPPSMRLALKLLRDDRGVEEVPFRDPHRHLRKGLRTADGKPAGVSWEATP